MNSKHTYQKWNDCLYKHFFNENKDGTSIILYVDDSLLNEIGRDIGKVDGFLNSCIYQKQSPTHFVDNFNSLVTSVDENNPLKFKIPPYFGALCLTIYAWTVDPYINGANYYDRLNGILSKYYFKAGLDPSLYFIGKNTNVLRDKLFRSLLPKAFDLLQELTILHKDMELGYYEFRKVGTRYVGIPKAQALISAKDRSGLELFFYHQNILPGLDLSNSEVKNMIVPLALHPDYLTQSTIYRWKDSLENQEVICAIVSKLILNWDGYYIDEKAHWDSDGKLPKRQSGASLLPAITVKSSGNHVLGWRIMFLNGEFPIDSIKFQDFAGGQTISRQRQGWSHCFPALKKDLVNLLSSSTKKTIKCENKINIRYSPKDIYFFEKANHLGGYVPANDISINNSYLILLRHNKSIYLLNDNNFRLDELLYEPVIEDWKLFSVKITELNFLKCFKELGIKQSSKQIELVGGANIGHRSRNQFSEVVPPQIKMANILQNGYRIVVKLMSESADLIQNENNLHSIPKDFYKPGIFEIIVVNAEGKKSLEYNTLKFKLKKAKMPDEGDVHAWQFGLYVEPTINFLYQYRDFYFEIEGGRVIDRVNSIFLQPDKESSIILKTSRTHRGLTLFSNDYPLQLNDSSDCTKYILPESNDNSYSLVAKWHGIEICKKKIKVISKPKIAVEVHNAISSNREGTIWLSKNFSDTCLTINVEANYGSKVDVYLNSKKISEIENGSHSIHISKSEVLKLRLDWYNHELIWMEYSFYPLPKIEVKLDEKQGEKWENSNIFKPSFPPVLNLSIENSKWFPKENMQCFLGDTILNQKVIRDGYYELTFPVDHHENGTSLQFSMILNEASVPLKFIDKISILKKPTCEISVVGNAIDPLVYYQNNLPKFKLNTKTKDIKLVVDDREINSDNYGYYQYSRCVFNTKESQKDISIQVYWWGELIESLTVTIIRSSNYLIEFIGGKNITLEDRQVYLIDGCPTEIKVKPKEIVNQIIVKFGERGKKTQHLLEYNDNVFSLGNYSKNQGSIYIAEIWQGEIKLHSARFTIAGQNWYRLGYHPGQLLPVNSDELYHTCWIAEKRGRALPKIMNAGNCPLDAGDCPCDRIKSNNTQSITFKKKWEEIVRRGANSVSSEEMNRWRSYYRKGKK